MPTLKSKSIWRHIGTTQFPTLLGCGSIRQGRSSSAYADDFGIKYTTKKDTQYLLETLRQKYTVTTDWSGINYCGLTIQWDYRNCHVDISMPGYINKLLKKLQHNKPEHPVHAPHKWSVPLYGCHIQPSTPLDTSQPLPPTKTKLVQSIVGALLYYAKVVDPSMHLALNEILITQSAPTTETLNKCKQLLDYVSWHPNATIHYHASNMIPHVDSNAVFIVLPRARSRLTGHFSLDPGPLKTPVISSNCPILTKCKTIRHVVSSAVETETAVLFHNAQTARPIRRILTELGHLQPPTPLKTDSATANAFIHQTMRHKRSKSWDMQYWWLKENSVQSEYTGLGLDIGYQAHRSTCFRYSSTVHIS